MPSPSSPLRDAVTRPAPSGVAAGLVTTPEMSAQPRGGREIDLDLLRGIAILMVLDFHAPVHWMSYPFTLLGFPPFGWAGVDVFFILSGFLVGGLLVKEWRLKGAVDSRRFLIRRGLKIWPQYYVFLGLMLLTRHRSLRELWGNLANLQNYVGGIPHTWSLAVEEHAYLLLVLVFALVSGRKVRPRNLAWGLVAVSLLVSAARLCLGQAGFVIFNRTHTRIEGILEGVVLALLYHHRPDVFQRLQAMRGLWLAVLAGALLFLRVQGSAPWAQSLGWDAANFLGIALLMLLYRPGRRQSSAWSVRVLAWIGVYSYGIYLWHVAVIAPSAAFARRMPGALAPLCLALLPVLAGIGLGCIFTKCVELPALALRDRWYPRRVDSPVGPPAEEEEEAAASERSFPAEVPAVQKA